MVEIPAGWSQIPLQGETPYQLETGLANTQLAQANTSIAQTKAGEEADLAPIQTQLAQNALNTSNAQQPVTQLTALAQRQTLEDNLIAEAASHAKASDNPQQAWQDSMTALADEGVGRATQLAQAGYSDKLATTVQTFGGTGTASRAGGTQLSAGSPGDGTGGNLTQYSPIDQTIDRFLANVPPAQQTPLLQQKVQTLDQVRQALLAIRSAPDPIAAFDQHATALAPVLGIQNPAGRFAGNPQGLMSWLQGADGKSGALGEVDDLENGFQTRLARGNLGLPQPLAPAQIEKTNEGDYAIRPDGKGGFTSTPITPIGKSILVGRTDDGLGVYFNPTTQTETTGNVKLDNKPGTARDTATMQKYGLLTAAGMPPEEAGMIVSGAKQMQPAEIVAKAQQLATQQVTAEEGGVGGPGFVGKVQERADQLQAQLTAANAISVPAPGAPGAGGAGPGGRPAPAGQDYGPAPGKGIDPSVKLKQLSAAPAQYQAARAQLVKTGNWKAFDAVFGQGAAAAVMAAKNRSAYTGP